MSIESRSRQYGKVFDHWQIQEFLGSGSGGKTAVFRVVRSDSDRGASALKVVNLIEERGSLQSLPEYRRKEYEAARQACSKSAEQEVWLMDELRGNTNIVDYLDHTFVDWSDGTGFGRDMLIRMELLKDLRSDLRTGRIFREEEVLKVGRDVCTALILCHRKNILHRDVKPENIFRNKDGNYKLGDFGVSRVLDACPGAVASTGIGTYEYWPAEQMTGRYDTRVDIYSLGLVLYELSNRNRLPFAASAYANSREVSQRLSGAELPAPCDASPALARVILKACAHDPEERFPNAEAFLRALRHVSAAAAAERTRQVPEERYVTAAAANRTESSHAARRTVLEAVAAEKSADSKIKKKKWYLVASAAVMFTLTVGWGLRAQSFDDVPDAPLPQETAQMQAVSTEAAPETAVVLETTTPAETEVFETTAPGIQEIPETEPVEPVLKEQAVEMTAAEPKAIVGIVNSLGSGVNIRSGPGTDKSIKGKYKTGNYVAFLETTDVDGVGWGRTEDGWICLDYVYLLREQVDGGQIPVIARVTTLNGSVNIRSGPGTDDEILEEYKAKTNIELLEIVDVDGVGWGRTEDGWVCLSYVCLLRERTENEGVILNGCVNSRSIGVNIRQEPTSTIRTVGSYPAGAMIEIREITRVNGIQWGHTEDGWVCMTYVNIIPEQETGEDPIRYTGWAVPVTELDVRQTPAMQAIILKRLLRGEYVNIYETCVADGKRWGRCDDGWVDLQYVDLLPVDQEHSDVRVVKTEDASIYSEAYRFNQIGNCEKLEVVLVYEYGGYGGKKMCRTDQGWMLEDCLY